MKILHINTHPSGGAFNGTYRLHKALLKEGMQSKILVNIKIKNKLLEKVYIYNSTTKTPNILNRVSTRFGFPTTAMQKKFNYIKNTKNSYEIISFPFSDFDITESQLYKEADIINLHWIANFLDYKTFFQKNIKPIIWTLRDLNPLLGIFHYKNDILNNQNQKKLIDLENNFLVKKISYISRIKHNMKIVGISNWITNKSKRSKIFKHLRHQTIHNCIDVSNYHIFDKNEMKKKFKIPKNHIVFSFVSAGVNNRWKGIDLLIQVLATLPKTKNIKIITVGGGMSPQLPSQINHSHLGELSQNELNEIYCASDAFIFPTKEESLGNVMLEAMACGTPVIGTPAGGPLDVIKPKLNGLLSKNISSESLKETIIEFIHTKNEYNPIKIRNYIKNNHSEKQTAEKYINLYKTMLT